MRARFLGKDPQSGNGGSPTLFATDRTDRKTYLVQGWKVSDTEALSDVGKIPGHETIVEIPEEIIEMAVRHYQDRTKS